MKQYLELLEDILKNGNEHIDRTGTGRRSIIGRQLRFKMADGFPMLTTRQLPFKTIVKELLWFISGSTDVRDMGVSDNNIWSKWAVAQEDVDAFVEKYSELNEGVKADAKNIGYYLSTKINKVGSMYGGSWRNIRSESAHLLWPVVPESYLASDKLETFKEAYQEMLTDFKNNPELQSTPVPEWHEFITMMSYSNIDQLQNLIVGLRERPFSSRHVISAWMPESLPFEHLSPQENVCLERASLAPCHMTIQCFVEQGKGYKDKHRLSLLFYMRSSDVPVGLGFNIAQYALLLHMLSHILNYEPYELIYSVGDAHVYLNQYETVYEQTQRSPRTLPTLNINTDNKDMYSFKLEDFELVGYDPHPPIKHPVSV